MNPADDPPPLQVGSLRPQVMRLQLVAIIATALLLAGILGSLQFHPALVHEGSASLVFRPTSLSIGSAALGVLMFILYFVRLRALSCPRCKQRLIQQAADHAPDHSNQALHYRCESCRIVWQTGISLDS